MHEKLEELMLYIAHKSHDDPRFSYTKLNKILFLADFWAYGLWGESITGATYIRNHHGPTPKEILNAQRNLEKDGRATIEEENYFGYTKKRLAPLANPDLTPFTTEQIKLVNDAIKECRNLTATQLSEWTHTLAPWLSAVEGEEIPYETIFTLKRIPVGKEDILWANEMVAELGLAEDA